MLTRMRHQRIHHAELGQDAESIRRELQPGADLVKSIGLLEHMHIAAAARERQRRGSSRRLRRQRDRAL